MNEEEKQAIDILNTFIFRQKTKNYNKLSLEDIESVKKVLNLIEKQQKQIEEKSKKYVDLCFEAGKTKADLDIAERVIDKMAQEIFIEYNPHFSTPEQVKEYFYKEIENE